jgi:uncharacterized protein (DUF58 family)
MNEERWRAEPKASDARSGEEAEGITAFLNPEEMHTLGRLALRSRSVVEGNLAGAHRSPFHGPSSEFADHKAYGIGDDPKHIDWRVVARTDKYYVKRYEDETNLRVYLALDRSASMDFAGNGEVTKYAFACRLAAALGYVVVKARDSVGLALHADKVDVMMDAKNSLLHLNNLLKTVQKYAPGSTTNIAEALHQIAGSVGRRALIVIISDLLGDDDAIRTALAHLRKQNHDVIVLHVLDPVEIDLSFKKPSEFRDLETGDLLAVDPRGIGEAYRKAFGEYLEQIQQHCQGLNIDYRLVRSDQPLETFVRAYLNERKTMTR